MSGCGNGNQDFLCPLIAGGQDRDEEKEAVTYGNTGLVCSMTGDSWESMPYPIVVDSGASASVMPESWCEHFKIHETEASRHGVYYTAANGQKIYNKGERHITMMTQEGIKRNMRFQACNVERPLGSASQFCKAGHSVVFNPPEDPRGSCIEHRESGERMYMESKDGVYVLETKIAPAKF